MACVQYFHHLFVYILILIFSSNIRTIFGSKDNTRIPPKIHLPQIHYTFSEFNSIYLHCNATGNPKPKVSWRYGNYPFVDYTRLYPNGTIRIDNLTDVRLEGAWNCVAENQFGKAVSDFIGVVINRYAAVRAYELIPKEKIRRNKQFMVKCTGYGSLPTFWEWYMDGARVHKHSDGKILREDSEVLRLRLNYSSNVTCVIKNDFSRGNLSIYLHVEDADDGDTVGPRPPKPTPTSVLTTTRPSIKCVPYTEPLCKKWLLPGHRWAVDPAIYQNQAHMVRNMFQALQTASFHSDPLQNKQCIRGLKALTCGRAYPSCTQASHKSSLSGDYGLGSICREHCEAVEKLFCKDISLKKIWTALRKANVKDSTIRRFLPDQNLPMCEKTLVSAKWLQADRRDVASSSNKARESGRPRATTAPSLPVCTMVDFEPQWRNPNVNQLEIYAKTKGACYKDQDRGELYNGTQIYIKASGKYKKLKCALWNNTDVIAVLRRKGYSLEAFPSLRTAGRSCRNPAGLQFKPFCVPENPTKRAESAIETCDIKSCHDYLLKKDKDNNPGESFMIILGFAFAKSNVILGSVVLIIVLVLVAFLVIYCVFRLRRRGLKKKGGKLTDKVECGQVQTSLLPNGSSLGASYCSDFEFDDANNILLTPNQDYHGRALAEFISPQLQKLECPRGEINDIKELGRGAFGEVYLVEAPKLTEDKKNQKTHAAMKILKNDATPEMQIQFLREATLLASLDHKNIVRLVGISLIYKPFCMLMEYMDFGDLNSFLRRHDPNNRCNRDNPDLLSTQVYPRSGFSNGHVLSNGSCPKEAIYIKPQPIELNRGTLCRMAVDIAEGMIYLSHLNYVHRDLASRNCLLDSKFNVKIADFGLCRHIRRGEDFIDVDHGAMPVRWMPLESILERRFNLDTDIWSFGVLMWELFSYALQPYYGKTHDEVIEFLQKGSYLDKPRDAPDYVYRLMLRCWSRQRSERPTFAWLMRQLSELLRRWKDNEHVT